MTSTFAEGP
nr:unnamed protein product [Callosobruchus chinensis]